MRIVSLVPSATEILCLLGAGDRLVGRSHECDFPASVAGVPVLTGQRTSYAPGGAAAVDVEVRQSLEAGEALYTLNAEQLAGLRPDLIITQDLCSVCSIDLNSVRAAVEAIGAEAGHSPRLLSLNPKGVEDVLDDILRVGEAIGEAERARAEVVRLRERLYRAQEFVNAYDEGPIVGFLEWTDPIFVAGHWTVQMIERAGGRHPLNETIAAKGSGAGAGMGQGQRLAGPSVRVPPEVLCAVKPEALIVCPCGLTLDEGLAETRRLSLEDWWEGLPAVRSGRVAVVDGNQMFNRPGPRLVDAFDWLVGWLQGRPGLTPTGFPWKPWIG